MDLPMPTRLPLLRLPILVVLLALAGLLWASASHAAQPGADIAPLAFEEEFEGEEEIEEGEGEFEERACEGAEEEFDEGELSGTEVKEICEEEAIERRKKAADGGGPAPEECILRSAHSQASTPGKGDKLKLTVGYTTYEPVSATIAAGHIATVHRHLGHSGVIRVVVALHGDNAPKQLHVQIKVPGSPSSCGKYLTQTIKVH
jgi:hypothetical protein